MIRNEKGVALGAAMIFMVAVGVGSFFVLKSSQEVSVISAREIKDIRARAEAKKIFSMAGFLVSNNLILCKSAPWGAGNTPKQCRWSGTKSEKSYRPEEFGFHNARFEKDSKIGDVLTFDLIDQANFRNDPSAKVISRFPGSVKLSLLDLSENEALNKVVGEKSEAVKYIDDDHYVVKVDLNLALGDKEDSQKVQAGAVFKRPIAIPQLMILDSTCLSQCNAARGEHPYPSCRGPSTIDVNTKTDVVAVTENLGPGVLYDIDYERNVVFAGEVTGVNKSIAASTIDVPLNDYLDAGSKVEWVDQVECAAFIENVYITRQTRNISEAGVDIEREVEQHSEPAGSLQYGIQVGSKLSKIEPFRLNDKVLNEDGTFKGKLDKTTVTTTIYVQPEH